MIEENKNIPLVGYANRLSVRPKETISFKVSSELKSDYSVDLYRSISADPNPEGIGIKEEKVDNYFSSRLIKSRVQKHYPGSYARSQKQLNLDAEKIILKPRESERKTLLKHSFGLFLQMSDTVLNNSQSWSYSIQCSFFFQCRFFASRDAAFRGLARRKKHRLTSTARRSRTSTRSCIRLI